MRANKPSTRTAGGKSGLDLLEEATQLLRKGGLQTLLPFYVGSIPAVMGLLYFCSDMSRGAFAQARLIESAFGIAALYLWMKCWHAGFMRGLRYRLALQTPPPWTPPRLMRMAVVQVAVQPSGLFARLIAAFILVPYVWVYAFYQNVSVFGDGEEGKLRDVLRQAAAQAHLWPRQAHFALFFSFAFALLVALNIFVTILLAPQLLRTLFGWETIFSQRPLALLNTTVFVTVGALTYLCFDPLRKALFVVRCFYGTALQSGDDLRVGLRVLQMKARTITLAALFLFAAIPAPAQIAGGAGTAGERVDRVPRVDAARLDRSLEEVLSRREYTWRLPREKTPESQKGWLTAFVEDLLKTVLDWARKGVRLVEKLFDRLRDWFGTKERAPSKSSWQFADAAPSLLYGLVIVGTLLLALVLWRARGRNRKPIVAAQAAAPAPDLRSEEIVADQLPEDGWLKLAYEMMEAGELRLALRASYLAALAHLGRRDLITVARYKTNLDYGTELRRRARSDDRLITAFDENVRAFERAWYGWHEVTPETLGGFNRNLERIRGC